MTIREQIATLPDGYRELAQKYEKDQRWSRFLPPTNWDEPNWHLLGDAFSWTNSDEGWNFWNSVNDHLIDPSNPLPPLP